MSSLYWRRQPTWLVDPISGNDRDTGLAGHAIKTLEEISRRWGRSGTAGLAQATSITMTSPPPAGDVFEPSVAFADAGSLSLVGTPGIVATSTFTGVTSINRGTQTFQAVTDAAVLGGSWAPYVGTHMVRIVGGPRAGSTAYVYADLGSQTARTTRFSKPNLGTFIPTFATMAPQVGDAYQLLLPTKVSVGVVRVQAANNSVATKQLSMVDVFAHSIVDSSLFTGGGMAGFRFANCQFDAFRLTGAAGNAQGCNFNGATTAAGLYIGANAQFLAYTGGALNPPQFLPGSNSTLDLDFLFSSTTPLIQTGAVVTGGLVACFGAGGLWLEGGNYYSDPGNDSGLDLLWGAGLTSNALTVRNGTFAYTTKPTLMAGSGTPREVRLGGSPGFTPNGTDITWAMVPAADIGSGSFIATRIS